ncbi:hypothetical protein HF086_015491 [Spodoptera exigua]|uniref:Uncharacterized protein n=1 Tax=Spodoptera exigua TaxID=7107 RepID=A0A922SF58_SPOEX|nr:hypothetical protein HF086_015491 [Spodoptera exigua]
MMMESLSMLKGEENFPAEGEQQPLDIVEPLRVEVPRLEGEEEEIVVEPLRDEPQREEEPRYNLRDSVGAALVLILETMWVAALFVDLLCRRGEYTLSLRCWDFTRWSCGRARAAMYACGATALLFAHLTLFATISGGMLLVLAALRAAVPFSPYATHGPHSPRAGSSLLSQHDSPLPDVFYNAAHNEEDR